MIGTVENKPGWRCEVCKQIPPAWWSTSCPRGCGKIIMACGQCASRANVETEIEKHLATCDHDVLPVLSGPPSFSPPEEKPRPSTRDMVRAGARAGATMGAARGGAHAVGGGALGAALGALAGHVLGRPEIQPVLDLIQGLREPVDDVLGIVRNIKK